MAPIYMEMSPRNSARQIAHAIHEDASVERIDEFLADFGGSIDFPVAIH